MIASGISRIANISATGISGEDYKDDHEFWNDEVHEKDNEVKKEWNKSARRILQ